jgi:hypothetical protein
MPHSPQSNPLNELRAMREVRNSMHKAILLALSLEISKQILLKIEVTENSHYPLMIDLLSFITCASVSVWHGTHQPVKMLDSALLFTALSKCLKLMLPTSNRATFETLFDIINIFSLGMAAFGTPLLRKEEIHHDNYKVQRISFLRN